MKKPQHDVITGIVAALLGLSASLNLPAIAASGEAGPKIVSVPANQVPTIPEGLKRVCMVGFDQVTEAEACSVIKYQGITTWAFSFIDNRYAVALVSYDATGKTVRNVEHEGTRYVWGMVPNPLDRTVTILGQAGPVTYAKGNMPYSVTVPWSELGR